MCVCFMCCVFGHETKVLCVLFAVLLFVCMCSHEVPFLMLFYCFVGGGAAVCLLPKNKGFVCVVCVWLFLLVCFMFVVVVVFGVFLSFFDFCTLTSFLVEGRRPQNKVCSDLVGVMCLFCCFCFFWCCVLFAAATQRFCVMGFVVLFRWCVFLVFLLDVFVLCSFFLRLH